MHTYKGKKIVVHYDEEVCIHAAECINRLPAVFDVRSRPWINPDKADAENVKRTIGLCPSGALSYEIPENQS